MNDVLKDIRWMIFCTWVIIMIISALTLPAIRNAIDVNTCITAQGKYLDESDYEKCGYKP